MPGWRKTREDRQNDAKVYGDPVYKRNRAVALRRAGGRCQCQGCTRHAGPCGRSDRPLQVDHIVPASVQVDHSLGNLRVLCKGPGSCHDAKTSQEGAGYRRVRDPQPRRRTTW